MARLPRLSYKAHDLPLPLPLLPPDPACLVQVGGKLVQRGPTAADKAEAAPHPRRLRGSSSGAGDVAAAVEAKPSHSSEQLQQQQLQPQAGEVAQQVPGKRRRHERETYSPEPFGPGAAAVAAAAAAAAAAGGGGTSGAPGPATRRGNKVGGGAGGGSSDDHPLPSTSTNTGGTASQLSVEVAGTGGALGSRGRAKPPRETLGRWACCCTHLTSCAPYTSIFTTAPTRSYMPPCPPCPPLPAPAMPAPAPAARRWAKERYEAAQRSLVAIMQRLGATAGE
jgi:hypothetical protein